MRRDELLTPGKYSAIPKDVMSARIPSSAKLVYMAIVDRLGDNEYAWPSLSTIMRDTGLSRQSVVDALKTLNRLGAVIAIQDTTCPKASNTYAVYPFGQWKMTTAKVSTSVSSMKHVSTLKQQLVKKLDYPSQETRLPASQETRLPASQETRPELLHPNYCTSTTEAKLPKNLPAPLGQAHADAPLPIPEAEAIPFALTIPAHPITSPSDSQPLTQCEAEGPIAAPIVKAVGPSAAPIVKAVGPSAAPLKEKTPAVVTWLGEPRPADDAFLPFGEPFRYSGQDQAEADKEWTPIDADDEQGGPLVPDEIAADIEPDYAE